MNEYENTLQSCLEAASFAPRSLSPPAAWIGHLPFAAWVMREVTPGLFVELGTHTGNSYFAFCQTVHENHLPTKCYAVDTWQGDPHAGHYDEKVFHEVNQLNSEHYASFSQLLRMTFNDAVNYFTDESIDLLHIDGLHTYEAVSHDFETWLPKMAPGGVVLFHDTNVREQGFGVWRLWEEVRERYPNHLEFLHSHGLGVIQIKPEAKTRLPWLERDSPVKSRLVPYFSALGSHQMQCFRASREVSELGRSLTAAKQEISALTSIVETVRQWRKQSWLRRLFLSLRLP